MFALLPTPSLRPLTQLFQYGAASMPAGYRSYGGERNQDSCACFAYDDLLLALVSDGVGSCPESEWGSSTLLPLMHRAFYDVLQERRKELGRALERSAAEALLADVQSRVITDLNFMLRRLVPRRMSDQERAQARFEMVRDRMLCTVVGALVTPRFCAIFSCGDGMYMLNGQAVELKTPTANTPLCLGYRLADGPAVSDQKGNRLMLQQLIHTEMLQNVVVASDGALDLATRLGRNMPGSNGQVVAPLSCLWGINPLNNKRLQQALCALAQPQLRVVRRQSDLGKSAVVQRASSLLNDDCSLVVIRRN